MQVGQCTYAKTVAIEPDGGVYAARSGRLPCTPCPKQFLQAFCPWRHDHASKGGLDGFGGNVAANEFPRYNIQTAPLIFRPSCVETAVPFCRRGPQDGHLHVP